MGCRHLRGTTPTSVPRAHQSSGTAPARTVICAANFPSQQQLSAPCRAEFAKGPGEKGSMHTHQPSLTHQLRGNLLAVAHRGRDAPSAEDRVLDY